MSSLLFATLSLNVACAPVGKTEISKVTPLAQEYVWYDGDREQKIWLNPNVVADFNPATDKQSALKSAIPKATPLQTKNTRSGMRMWQLNSASAGGVSAAMQSLKSVQPDGKYSPIFHDGPNSTASMRALPGNIIVYLNPAWDVSAVNAWLKTRKLEVVKKLAIGANVYVIKTGPGIEALNTANELYKSGEVTAAFPDWWQEVEAK